MKSKLLSGVVLATMAMGFVAASSTPAHASFIAYICNDANCTGGGDLQVTDNGVGDTNPLVGAISFSTSTPFNGLTFISNVSQTTPLLGSANEPVLDVNYAATGTGFAWLFASDTGFTAGPGPLSASLENGGTLGGGLVSASGFGGTSNTNLDLSHMFVTLNGFGTASGLLTPTTNPYSLSLGVFIDRRNAPSNNGTTGNADLTVPEPVSMSLFGLGMLGTGIVTRRRNRRSL